MNDLLEKLKQDGLELTEDAAIKVVNRVFDWAELKIQESANQYDDLLLALLPKAKEAILNLCDKIDGQEG